MPTIVQSSTTAQATGNEMAQPSSAGEQKAENGISGDHQRLAEAKLGKDAEATEALPGAGPHEWLSTDGHTVVNLDKSAFEESFRLQHLVPAGPWLQYLGQKGGAWRGSVLIILPPAMVSSPTVTYNDEGAPSTADSRKLRTFDGWHFWRFDLTITLTKQEQEIPYSLDVHDAENPIQRRTFWVPASTQPMHYGFHSCNGLSVNADYKKWKEPLLWKDVLVRHSERPLHLILGGGDQLYNDGFWKLECFQKWLSIPGNKERYEHPFTPAMEKELSAWLHNHYRQHYSLPLLLAAFSVIPQANIYDDHDIFDGWGSYPDDLQSCLVFQGIFHTCQEFYLLYQHHTTRDRAYVENDMFGTTNCFSFMRSLGPTQELLCPDVRGERTRSQIMSVEHYQQVFSRLEALPDEKRHLVAVFTVPLVWPELPLSETILGTLDKMSLLKGVMAKTGVGAGIMDKFHHVELLDDLQDSYHSAVHIKERNNVIHRFQELTRTKQLRVTFLSGDVHCCGVGRLYTTPKMKHLTHDFRYIPQVTSSAIWNQPPPAGLLNLLNRTNIAHKIDPSTREKMVKLFKVRHPENPKLLGRRNWCEITEYTATAEDPRLVGALNFSLRAEDPKDQAGPKEVYNIPVPPYVHNPAGMRRTFKSKQILRCQCFTGTPSVTLDPLEEF